MRALSEAARGFPGTSTVPDRLTGEADTEGDLLHTSPWISHLTHLMIQRLGFYCFHFTEEETEASAVSGRAQSCTVGEQKLSAGTQPIPPQDPFLTLPCLPESGLPGVPGTSLQGRGPRSSPVHAGLQVRWWFLVVRRHLCVTPRGLKPYIMVTFHQNTPPSPGLHASSLPPSLHL